MRLILGGRVTFLIPYLIVFRGTSVSTSSSTETTRRYKQVKRSKPWRHSVSGPVLLPVCSTRLSASNGLLGYSPCLLVAKGSAQGHTEYGPMACWILLQTSWLVIWSLYAMRKIFRKHLTLTSVLMPWVLLVISLVFLALIFMPYAAELVQEVVYNTRGYGPIK